jgi:periplasmic divalent cation tolerance protein
VKSTPQSLRDSSPEGERQRGIVTVYCVFADEEEAQRIGRTVVEESLAACVNILAPCRSVYRWNGKVEEADEVPALFKTTDRVADRLVERLALLHSYDVPAITVWPVDRALGDYSGWVERSVLQG